MIPTPKPLQFKINFVFNLIYTPRAGGFRGNGVTELLFHTKVKNYKKTLTNEEISEANYHFNNGLRVFKKNKFDKAVIEFAKCIEIDPTNTDAYYNLADSYQKLRDTKSACGTWKTLKDMGQKGGEKLYEQNCK